MRSFKFTNPVALIMGIRPATEEGGDGEAARGGPSTLHGGRLRDDGQEPDRHGGGALGEFSRQTRRRDNRRRTWRGCRTGRTWETGGEGTQSSTLCLGWEAGEEGGLRRGVRAGEAKDKPGAEADEARSTEDGDPVWEDGRHIKDKGEIKSIA